ncbi:MAG: slipin family protein, partial [Candidatus Thermoplasmatota archaeon]
RVSHFRFGRFIGVKGPGVVLIIPFIDDLEWKDLRVRDMDVSEQNIITKDNVSANVDAVAYMKVFDPKKATLEVKDHYRATSRLAQTTLRDVLGKVELDELLSRREELAEDIRQIIDEETDAWGVKVTNMTIRNVNLPKDMVRAIASQAEAERNRRARVKKAQGEEEAAKKMADAAEIYGEREGAMRLRELQTLVEIATEQNLVVVTPSNLGSDLGNVAGLTTALEEHNKKSEIEEEE